jgi:ATP-dependent RNA helicase DeaD
MSDPENKPVIPDNDGTFNHQEAQRADEPATKQLLPPAKFEDLSEPMQAAFQRAGWTEMMPVQAITIPYILERRDLMVQSRTGSGKTGAYLLPMLRAG